LYIRIKPGPYDDELFIGDGKATIKYGRAVDENSVARTTCVDCSLDGIKLGQRRRTVGDSSYSRMGAKARQE